MDHQLVDEFLDYWIDEIKRDPAQEFVTAAEVAVAFLPPVGVALWLLGVI